MLVVGFGLTTFGISAGYHRLFAHRSYTTGRILEASLLLLGAAAVQNSALTWATKHRLHHQHTDTDRDPYNARRGFWYSHIGWVVSEDKEDVCDTSDLQADPLVRAQHRWYLPLAILLGFGLPTLIGWSLDDALGGLLFGGVWRLLLSYHATFSINSFAHYIGTQPYSTKGTARDNLFAAIVTMGEGYHNFHHTFPGDYRNGVRFFDFDPPKWVLAAWAYFGWIRDVRRTPGHVIALRRLKTARQHLEQKATLAITERQVMAARADKLKQLLTQWAKAHVPRPNAMTAVPPTLVESRRAFWKAFNAWEADVMS
jgi:stearoyl-CoA desaturase (delta-9 desaturase)